MSFFYFMSQPQLFEYPIIDREGVIWTEIKEPAAVF